MTAGMIGTEVPATVAAGHRRTFRFTLHPKWRQLCCMYLEYTGSERPGPYFVGALTANGLLSMIGALTVAREALIKSWDDTDGAEEPDPIDVGEIIS